MKINRQKPEVVLRKSNDVTPEAVSYTMPTRKGNVELSIFLGDLTQAKVDAIVCPSNGGYELAIGGVQNAIERRAGMATFHEATAYATKYGSEGVPLGHSVSTTAGNLKQLKGIIHVNNMRTSGGVPCDQEVIELCVENVLFTTQQNNFKSVAFPAMGTGIWGMSLTDALKGTIAGIQNYFNKITDESPIEKVGIVIYAQPSIENANQMQQILSDVLRK